MRVMDRHGDSLYGVEESDIVPSDFLDVV